MKIKFTLILCIFFAQFVCAQNVDSLFIKARDKAFNKEYYSARALCKQVLKASPGYVDADILVGRTYSWEGKYDSAKIALKYAIDKKPECYDAITAMIDANSWGDDFAGALTFCNYGLAKYKGDKDFLIKKIKTYNNLKRYDLAMQIVDSMLVKKPTNDTLLQLQHSIKVARIANKISASYTLDSFSDTTTWHLIYLQYSRKTPWGSVIGRINYGSRFGHRGFQFEFDAYPNLGKKMYGYFNIGSSNISIFPNLRIGAELYRSFPHSIEGSLGWRYLNFSGSSVNIFTAYAGKYFGNYWFSFRTFVTPSSDGTNASVSGGLILRRYFGDGDNYIGIGGGYGSSPDDRRRYFSSADALRLKSYNLKLNYSHKFNDFWIMTLGYTYENQEKNSGSTLIDNTFDISCSYLF